MCQSGFLENTLRYRDLYAKVSKAIYLFLREEGRPGNWEMLTHNVGCKGSQYREFWT